MNLQVENHPVTIKGRLFRIGKLRDEYYDFIHDPAAFIAGLRSRRAICDLFTFIQEVPDRQPRFDYPLEMESVAVLPVTTYENWWNHQIGYKTRNMIRKGAKMGLEVRPVEFSDELVSGIARICNETPIRQGRRFKHYGKSTELIKVENASFLERSEFIGAYYQGELVGYIKLVHGRGISNLMQILALNSQRDKAPTNSLIARAVASCAKRGSPLLQYGTWSRRSMGVFKVKNAFERWEIPRYYVPLTLRGHALLASGFHRGLIHKIPETWVDQAAALRLKFNSIFANSPAG